MKNRIRFMVLFVCLLPIAVHAQTTEFTYQGRLIDGTNPANGQYDFQFKRSIPQLQECNKARLKP